MVAIQDGKYAHTALPDPALGPRKVDVDGMYNVERFRPRYEGKLGDPMLLVGAAARADARSRRRAGRASVVEGRTDAADGPGERRHVVVGVALAIEARLELRREAR